jgi:hypothetical protein
MPKIIFSIGGPGRKQYLVASARRPIARPAKNPIPVEKMLGIGMPAVVLVVVALGLR